MPRPAGHPARRRWLVTAAVIAAIAGASGFFSAGLSAWKSQFILREGSVTVSIATRGVPYTSNIGVSDFRHLPNWTFERGWWDGGGCTCSTLNVAMPLWIPFAASCLMAGIAPLIPRHAAKPMRLMVGTGNQPTIAILTAPQ